MPRFLLLCGLTLVAPFALTAAPLAVSSDDPSKDIIVDGTQMLIPAPVGFVPVTSDMEPYATAMAHLATADNIQQAAFLSVADAAIVHRGKMPVHERRVYVQTSAKLAGKDTTLEQFSVIKKLTTAIYDNIRAGLGNKTADLVTPLPNAHPEADILGANATLTELIPMPVHYETENAMAFSMYARCSVYDEHAQLQEYESVVTSTVVLVQGKVIFLYVTADKTDLQWTRSTSRKWTKLVLAANP